MRILGNFRQQIQMARVGTNINKHMKKRCAYCDLDFGHGNQTPVLEFIKHLEEKHNDKLIPSELEEFKRVLKN